ncbi:hypothetical protein [Streptosporangium sp. NPDC049644]|uniref:hypothetical protein n=1 Tax=Streptosporangium sp. NPDC049644 TaxID=3155507 RepID=UPI00344110E4
MSSWVRITRDDGAGHHPPPDRVVFADGGDSPWGCGFPSTGDARVRAASEWVATACAAVGRAREGGVRAAEVVGTGVLASLVRRALPEAGGRVPDVIVDTTGSARAVADALSRVARLGTVVLAARPTASALMVRTYQDVHVRGLTVVGVPWATGATVPTGSCLERFSWALERLRPWDER